MNIAATALLLLLVGLTIQNEFSLIYDSENESFKAIDKSKFIDISEKSRIRYLSDETEAPPSQSPGRNLATSSSSSSGRRNLATSSSSSSGRRYLSDETEAPPSQSPGRNLATSSSSSSGRRY